MQRLLVSVAALGLSSACGRLGFIGLSDDAPGDDAGSVDGVPDRPNRAFVTPNTVTGNFGGIAAADAMCATQALTAALPGTFIALLSDSTTNARDRLAGSRGWVRADGVPLADGADDFFIGGNLLVPLNVDAMGVGPPLQANVWTASTTTGTYDAANGSCSDWTSTTGSALSGFHNRNPPFIVATVAFGCSNGAHLYCLEIGHDSPVAATQGTGRIAFIGTATANNAGIAGFDARCQSDATAAGLPGTYLAAVNTTTQTARSRMSTTMPWRRPDGQLVTRSGDGLFDGTRLIAFLDKTADGIPLTATTFVTGIRTGGLPMNLGTLGTTCDDWSTTTGQATIGFTNSVLFDEFWASGPSACSNPLRSLCLQQ